MTSQFEFETIPWSGEMVAQEGEFGAGETEWESEYGRGRPPMRVPTRVPPRPSPAVRPRWPVRHRIRTAFPVIPWSGGTPVDVWSEPPPAVDAPPPGDEPEPAANVSDAPEGDAAGDEFEFGLDLILDGIKRRA